jgi:ribosomal protein L37AE/L43A
MMTYVHIATPESFMTDALTVEKVCAVCGHEAKIRYGYLDWHCSVCNLYVDPESFMGTIVYKIRNAMDMQRKEFSALLGIKHKSLSNAENCRCSQVIFDKSRALFHDFVKARNSESASVPKTSTENDK